MMKLMITDDCDHDDVDDDRDTNKYGDDDVDEKMIQ